MALNTIETDYPDYNSNLDSGTGIEDYYNYDDENAIDLRDVLYPDERREPLDYAFYQSADDGDRKRKRKVSDSLKPTEVHEGWKTWHVPPPEKDDKDPILGGRGFERPRQQLDYTLTPSFQPVAGGLLSIQKCHARGPLKKCFSPNDWEPF